MDKPKYAILYTRVSDIGQLNVEEQEPMLRKFAQQEGFIVKKVFTDNAKTATKMEGRENLYRAMAYIEQDKSISTLIVLDTDRLARQESDHFLIKAFLKKHGVKLVSKNQPGIDDTIEGQLLDGVMASVNAFYSRISGRKISNMLQQLVEKGRTMYKAPTGYVNVNIGTEEKPIKTVELEPNNSRLMENAFELFGTDNYSISELNELMYEKGLRSPRGGKFETSGFSKLLQNPYYIGKIKHNKKLYDGKQPKLISEKLFYQCQRIIQEHNQYAIRRRKPENHRKFFLRGFLKCGICGGNITGSHVQKKNCDYYYCSVKQYDKRYHSNKGQTTDINSLEDQITAFFGLFKLSPKVIQEVLGRAKEILEETHGDIDLRKEKLTRDNMSLEKQRQALEVKLLEGVISDDTYTRQHFRVDNEIEQNKIEIIGIDANRKDNTKIFEGLVRLANNLPKAYKKAPPEVKMMYLNIFWERFELKDTEISKAVPSKAVAALLNEKLIRLKETPETMVLITKFWWAIVVSNH